MDNNTNITQQTIAMPTGPNLNMLLETPLSNIRLRLIVIPSFLYPYRI